MRRLHVAPGLSAGGSLRAALRDSGTDEAVLPWMDDLSCGPIGSDDAQARVDWWSLHHPGWAFGEAHAQFWHMIDTTDARPTVWFGRHNASELAFFHAFVERLGSRPFDVVDVTGFGCEFAGRDGLPAVSTPAQSVGMIPSRSLRALFGQERAMGVDERDDVAGRWCRLRAENAPFRIVTENGLQSAPIDCFDALLLAQATTEWQRVTRLIGATMGQIWEHYQQVGEVMLLMRVVALVEGGQLRADGNPEDMFAIRVRLA